MNAMRAALNLVAIVGTAAAFRPAQTRLAAPHAASAAVAYRPALTGFAAPSAPAAAARHPPVRAMEPRILTEENAIAVLDECMADLGTMFGTNADSARVGITGMVEFVELDGPRC